MELVIQPNSVYFLNYFHIFSKLAFLKYFSVHFFFYLDVPILSPINNIFWYTKSSTLKEAKIEFHRNLFDWGSIPVDGSSMRTTFGWPEKKNNKKQYDYIRIDINKYKSFLIT